MKKLFILLCCLSFVIFSCDTKALERAKTATDSFLDYVENEYDNTNSLWNLRPIGKDVYWETNTDVLYYKNKITGAHAYLGDILLPIYEADGTLLTYSEWKEKNSGQ